MSECVKIAVVFFFNVQAKKIYLICGWNATEWLSKASWFMKWGLYLAWATFHF